MSITTEIIDYIRAESVPGILTVDYIASLQALLDSAQKSKIPVQKLPAIYVHPAGATSGLANISTGSINQKITRRFAILFVLPVINDASGSNAANKAEDKVDQLIPVLLGWKPDSADAPLTLSRTSEKLIAWTGNLFIYALYVECDIHLRKC